MHWASGSITLRIAAAAFISATFCVSLSAFPSAIAADTISTETRQVFPTGSNTCVPLSAYSFTPYIYEGALHSFEFTVPDNSYVALTGSVGNTAIPFRFMTRRGDAADALRVHVDISTTPIPGMLPLSVTLMSARGGQSVCMSTVVMTTSSASISSSATPPQTSTEVMGASVPPVTVVEPQPISTIEEPVLTPDDTVAIEEPAGEVSDSAASIGTDAETTAPTTSTTSTKGEVVASLNLASIQDRIVESCVAEDGASRLWILLLATYAIVTAIAVFAKLPASRMYSAGQRTATVVTPFVLLLGFWYFVESCRTSWAPVVAILVVLAGLIGVFWDDSRLAPYTTRIKSLVKKQTSVTPAATKNAPMITPPPFGTKKEPEIK